jgi:hypothetical protein
MVFVDFNPHGFILIALSSFLLFHIITAGGRKVVAKLMIIRRF